MKKPAQKLIATMDEYISIGRVPVRLALEADSDFEVSIQRLATFSDSLRQGYATEVMDELIRVADRFGVVIALEALPGGAGCPGRQHRPWISRRILPPLRVRGRIYVRRRVSLDGARTR